MIQSLALILALGAFAASGKLSAPPTLEISAPQIALPKAIAIPIPAIPTQAVPPAHTAPAQMQSQLSQLESAKPQDAPAVSRAVFDGAKAPAAAESVALPNPPQAPALAAARPRPIFRRVKPAKWRRESGFTKTDLIAYLGAATTVGLIVGTVVFAFKLSPGLGLLAVGAFAFLIRSIARSQREQRAPKDIAMPPAPKIAAAGELPPLPELRGQLNAALDHLIRSQRTKNRDIGEIARGISGTAIAIEAAGGFQGRSGWVSVEPRLLAAAELPGTLERMLSRHPIRDGIGPNTFFAKLDGLFDGLRAEARRAQSPEDLIQRLKWWPAHYRQFNP